ncbi:MAG TPA: alpha/beta fold hydrolase, partial [Myxococcota bacterium]|nr:alpha/beta fold hydrolase [Myxococcota bacterium]
MTKELRRAGTLAVAALALSLPMLLGTGSCHRNPIIFVHGGSGSGAQFESQAMRFTSNGYPQDHIAVLEYDSSQPLTTNPANMAALHARLDALIAELQAETGEAKVDLMGHSLGTFVSQSYLSTPARAANVAHYVNIDGGTASAPPGGVPTLALWAGAVNRPTPPQIVGATNVTVPDQEHVEVASSEESFREMFKFLRGK